jgi:hypothetical protein
MLDIRACRRTPWRSARRSRARQRAGEGCRDRRKARSAQSLLQFRGSVETVGNSDRRDGRVVEGTPLLREHTPKKVYRGFESLSLRHRHMSPHGAFFCGDGRGENPLVRGGTRAVRGCRRTPWRSARRSRARQQAGEGCANRHKARRAQSLSLRRQAPSRARGSGLLSRDLGRPSPSQCGQKRPLTD